MSFFLLVASNEIKQQLRRKALWVGVCAVFGVVILTSLISYSGTPDSTQYTLIRLSKDAASITGGYLILAIIPLCSNRILQEDDNGCLDILFTTTMRRRQYYFGKIIANLFLFSVIGLCLMILGIFLYATQCTIAWRSNFVPFFLLDYGMGVALIGTIAVISSLSFSEIFRNKIVSIVLSVLYFLPINLPGLGSFYGYFSYYGYFRRYAEGSSWPGFI